MAFNGFVQQVTISATATALAANQILNNMTLTAKSTNTGVIGIGFSNAVTTGNGYILEKGQTVTIKVANAAAVFVIGTANDVMSVIGS